MKGQARVMICFSHLVCSSVSTHQPLLFTAHYNVGGCYYCLIVFTAQLQIQFRRASDGQLRLMSPTKLFQNVKEKSYS